MGDRRMAEIKTEGGSIYLYSHWGGYRLPDTAKAAIVTARPRWNDQSYGVRIIIDQIFKDLRDSETGGGIMLKPNAEDEYNGDKPSVIIDMLNRSLTVIGEGAGNWAFNILV